jgi:hypothetical protein
MKDRNPDKSPKRLFRVAFNRKILNKNLNPKTRQPREDYYTFNNYFENCYLTINQIIEVLGKGWTMIFAHLSPNAAYCKRSNQNFKETELFALDIDGTITIEEALQIDYTRKALLLYTTVNHTPENHRFRLIFALPYLIEDSEYFKEMATGFIDLYNADSQCNEPTRPFFGNDKGIFINPKTGKKICKT